MRIAVILFLIFLNSCWYSFKGALPSHLQSIAIPIFSDRTAYPGLSEDTTDRLIQAFINDNTLKVVDQSRADLIMNGTVQRVEQRVGALQTGETVTEYQIYVTLKVSCEDVKTGKKLYDKTFSQYGLMSSTGTQDERDAAISEALDLLIEEILNATLGGW